MSSTNFSVGMTDSSRNSSRVLKPPGGGHSDIFGIYDAQEPKTPKSKNYPKSSISEVFGGNESVTNINVQKEKKSEEEQTDNQMSNENEAPKPPLTTPQRTRVPPGGFSSGLW